MRLIKNKTTGLVCGQIVMIFTFIVVVNLVFNQGVYGNYGIFFNWRPLAFILGFGVCITFMKERTINKDHYGTVLRKNLILAG